jgi:hypothetical protein
MTPKNLQDEIVNILKLSFKSLINSWNGSDKIRLTIPFEGKQKRLSEQEFRFLFIEQFLLDTRLLDTRLSDYSLSIETPTIRTYAFTNCKHNNSFIYPNSSGRRGNIDLVIYLGKERVCLIEFKANNASEFEHGKDFAKLKYEPGTDTVRIFAEVFKKTNDKTILSLKNKISCNKFCTLSESTIFLGFSINHNTDSRVLITYNKDNKFNISKI